VSKRNECLEVIRQVLANNGIAFEVKSTTKGHPMVSWQSNGHRRTAFTSKTPSDWRSLLNTRAKIRRLLRQDGALKD
jgi:hypothetical protein